MQEFKVFGKVNESRKQFLDELIKNNYSDDDMFLKISKPIYERFIKRCISIGYYALVDIQKVTPKLTTLDESIQWYPIYEVPDLIMHYNEVKKEALKSLKNDVNLKFNAFNLLPEKFTMNEVQSIYETIFEQKFTRSNFQKKILEMDVLVRLEKKYTGAKNKAPYLYRMK